MPEAPADLAKRSGMRRDAAQGKGHCSLGTTTGVEAEAIGRAWVRKSVPLWWCACLNVQNTDGHETNRTIAQRRKPSKTGIIHAKSTRTSTVAMSFMSVRTVAHTSSLLKEDITRAFVPPDAIVNTGSNQGAGFGPHNRTRPWQKE